MESASESYSSLCSPNRVYFLWLLLRFLFYGWLRGCMDLMADREEWNLYGCLLGKKGCCIYGFGYGHSGPCMNMGVLTLVVCVC